MGWFRRLLGLDAINMECVPRAFANSAAWAIKHKKPVFIADMKGHWESAAYTDTGEIEFLEGDGWYVWPSKKEGTNPIYKLRNLRNAMEHFIRHNPTCMPTDEEQAKLDARIKATFGTDPKDVE